MRYKGYVVTYAGEQLKVNRENYFINGICRENLDQPDVFQVNKDFGRRNFYAVTSGIKCDEDGDKLSQVAVDVLKGFYGSDFAEENRSYFNMANSAITGHVFEKRAQHFEVDISLLYIENDIATVYNFGDMPVFYYKKNNLKKLSGDAPQTVEIEKNVYDNKGTAHTQVVEKHNIPYVGFNGEECESVSYVSESVKLKHKAFFVLCSKSVLDVVGEQDIENILADTKIKGGNKSARIIDSAVKKNPDGNYTALVVQVDNGIPVTEADVKSVGAWAIIAMLCAVLYFTSSYILNAVSAIAESTKSFIENHFSGEVEQDGDLKWTPREDEEERQDETSEQLDEGTKQNEEGAEGSDENVTSEVENPPTSDNSTPQSPSTSRPEPIEGNDGGQISEAPTEPEPVVEIPGPTDTPETTEEVELPIHFN